MTKSEDEIIGEAQEQAIQEFQHALKEKSELGPMAKLNANSDANFLTKAYKEYAKCYTFQPGNLVKIKKYFDHNSIIRENQPLIIMSLIDPPIVNSNIADFRATYVGEVFDVRIGIVDSQLGIIQVAFDSRELEPFFC